MVKRKRIEKIVGTNCYNCKFVAEREEAVDKKELNEDGGIDPRNEDELKIAKKAGLIILPGGSRIGVKTKRYCNHREIKTHVTVRMCCAY